jgi:FixJ family two-component response regulator
MPWEITQLSPDFKTNRALVTLQNQIPPNQSLTATLMRRQQKIPIVFITAHGDETVRPRMLEMGAVECLLKPFSDTALREAVNAAFRMT